MIPTLLTLCLAAPYVTPAADVVRFDPPLPRLGDLVVVYLEDTDVGFDRGHAQLLGYEVAMFRVSASLVRGAAPVPIDIPPGTYPVKIVFGDRHVDTEVEIVDRPFETSELKVSRRFTRKKSAQLRARLRREARQLQALWSAEPTAPKNVGEVFRPVPGPRTSPYGVRRVFNGRTRSTHYGLDLDAKTGDPIRSAADGRVVLSARRWVSGGTVVVDHGGGLFTLYFHLSKRVAKAGDWVKRGQPIGEAGMTGRVTGPHLHLALVARAVRLTGPKKGQPRSMYVDPEPFLDLEFDGHPAFVRTPELSRPEPSADEVARKRKATSP